MKSFQLTLLFIISFVSLFGQEEVKQESKWSLEATAGVAIPLGKMANLDSDHIYPSHFPFVALDLAASRNIWKPIYLKGHLGLFSFYPDVALVEDEANTDVTEYTPLIVYYGNLGLNFQTNFKKVNTGIELLGGIAAQQKQTATFAGSVDGSWNGATAFQYGIGWTLDFTGKNAKKRFGISAKYLRSDHDTTFVIGSQNAQGTAIIETVNVGFHFVNRF